MIHDQERLLGKRVDGREDVGRAVPHPIDGAVVSLPGFRKEGDDTEMTPGERGELLTGNTEGPLRRIVCFDDRLEVDDPFVLARHRNVEAVGEGPTHLVIDGIVGVGRLERMNVEVGAHHVGGVDRMHE